MGGCGISPVLQKGGVCGGVGEVLGAYWGCKGDSAKVKWRVELNGRVLSVY